MLPTPSPILKDAFTSRSRLVNLPPQFSRWTTVPQAHRLLVPWARSMPHQVGQIVLLLWQDVLPPQPITDSCHPILSLWVRPLLRRTLHCISTHSPGCMGRTSPSPTSQWLGGIKTCTSDSPFLSLPLWLSFRTPWWVVVILHTILWLRPPLRKTWKPMLGHQCLCMGRTRPLPELPSRAPFPLISSNPVYCLPRQALKPHALRNNITQTNLCQLQNIPRYQGCPSSIANGGTAPKVPWLKQRSLNISRLMGKKSRRVAESRSASGQGAIPSLAHSQWHPTASGTMSTKPNHTLGLEMSRKSSAGHAAWRGKRGRCLTIGGCAWESRKSLRTRGRRGGIDAALKVHLL